MKKIFIFLSILIITILAVRDVKNIISDTNTLGYSKTPSQIEMSAPLNRKDIESKSTKFKENTQNLHDKLRKENQKNHQNDYFNMQNNMNKNKY